MKRLATSRDMRLEGELAQKLAYEGFNAPQSVPVDIDYTDYFMPEDSSQQEWNPAVMPYDNTHPLGRPAVHHNGQTFLDPDQIAWHMGASLAKSPAHALNQLRQNSGFPDPVKVPGIKRNLYHLPEVDKWLSNSVWADDWNRSIGPWLDKQNLNR